MRKRTIERLLATIILLLAATTLAAPPVGDVTLQWTPGAPLTADSLFVLRGSPTLTGNPTNWPVLTNVSGLSTQATVRIVPGAFFFVCQSSNLWGLSLPATWRLAPRFQRHHFSR